MMKLAIPLVLLVTCATLPGCGSRKVAEKDSQPISEKQVTGLQVSPRAMTLADHASLLAIRFPEVQHATLSRLEKDIFTLPVGATSTDATYRLELWVDRGVPNVAVSHAVQKKGGLFRQCAQLRNVALEARVDDKIVWQPKMMPMSKRPSLGTKIEDAEPPSEDPEERLRQMAVLATRFSMPGSTLKTEPVHRFVSPDYRVIDGGVFVFLKGTVRAILVLEAFKYANASGWQYKVNRFTSPPGSISFDGEEIRVWSGFWAGPKSDAEEYIEQKIGNVADGG